MIKFVRGDMFEGDFDILVNTVNCKGVMGAGVALAFKKRFPSMFKDYQRACKDGLVMPGKLHEWRSIEGDWIINFPTKRDWKDPSRYEDIDVGLDAFRDYIEPLGKITVALPALGCGNGGLNWEIVSQMILNKLAGLTAEIHVYAPSNSKRAHYSTPSLPNEEELIESKNLGYFPIKLSFDNDETTHNILISGDQKNINTPWISLLPSRDPAEREISALISIATELSNQKTKSPIALIYNNKSTETIISIFNNLDLNLVVLLPFGVLSRKALSELPSRKSNSKITLISSALPNSKWSQGTLKATTELLRSNSVATLFSDPDNSWFSKSDASWRKVPTFFVRYDLLSIDEKTAFESANTYPIGRKQLSGTPNLDLLLSIITTKEYVKFDNSYNSDKKFKAHKALSKTTTSEIHLTEVEIDAKSLSEWSNLGEAIFQENPTNVKITITINTDKKEQLEEKIIESINLKRKNDKLAN